MRSLHNQRGHPRHRESLSRAAPRSRGRLPSLTVLVIAVATPSLSLAHSWYPAACCTGQDCKKVDRIDYLPDGGLLMHFGGQQVIVPRGFEQQPSQDMDAHVCVYRNAMGRWVPRCVFLPAGA